MWCRGICQIPDVLKAAPTLAGVWENYKVYLDRSRSLSAWHVYTVLGVGEENGQRYVHLRNPWGNTEPGRDGKCDGVHLHASSFRLAAGSGERWPVI